MVFLATYLTRVHHFGSAQRKSQTSSENQHIRSKCEVSTVFADVHYMMESTHRNPSPSRHTQRSIGSCLNYHQPTVGAQKAAPPNRSHQRFARHVELCSVKSEAHDVDCDFGIMPLPYVY